MWAEDEFRPSEPQSPRLSDPDSDALYTINGLEDAAAAHLDDEGLRPHDIAPAEAPERRERNTSPAPSLTLDIAPPSEPDEHLHPALFGAERSNTDGGGAGLLRSARNDDSQIDHDALVPAEPAILFASAPPRESAASNLGLDTVNRAPDVPEPALDDAPARASAITAAKAEPAIASEIAPPVAPIALASPPSAPLQIAEAAPTMPVDQPANLEQKSSPIEGGEPPKAVEGGHQEARGNAQPLSRLSTSPRSLRAVPSPGRGGFASGSPLDTPAHASVEYPAPPRVAAAVAVDIATPVQPLPQPSPSAPPPSAFESATSPGGGGFTSDSALDLFAPPQLTAASYTKSEPAQQRFADAPASQSAQSPDTSEAEVLVLAPVVNGTPVNQIITVERRGSGFTLQAEDLRAFRVILDPSIKDSDAVALSTLPGVEALYVNASQSLELKIPDALLVPTEIQGVAGRTAISLSKIATTSGLLFNYRLFGTAETGGASRNRAQLTGDTELVGMTRLGLFVTNGFFASSGRKTFVRGDSFFRFDDNAHVRTYTVGDVASGAVSFSRSVRLGGVQVQSDFQQRPDLFTGPLPRFAGSAALPSSLDLYVDSLKVFSTTVPQGPFILRSLPQITGNELRIVTTDVNGRQTEVTTAYFNAPGLLRKGLVEYSAELGAPRIDSGLRSFGYRSQIFGSVTGRYGLANRLTVEGHAETGGGLINGGLGFIQALGKLGSLNGAAAASNYRGKQGTRLSAQYRFDQKRFSLFANVEREYGRYFDLGDVSSFRGPITDPAGLPIFPVRQRQSIERIGASYRPAFDPVSFNIAYNHLRQGNSEIRTANVALRRRITDRISFNGNAIFDLEKRHDVALSIGLDVRLGANARAFVGADRSNGRTNYNVSATGFGGGRQNALGYAISQRGNDDGDAFRSASLNYRFPQAFVAGTIDQSGRNVRGSVQLEGSLIAAGKDVFLANRVGEGFAVVKNAGPHVDILQGGRKIATSNGKGRALLPSLEPFSETRVSIDPATLPPELEAENGTDFRIVTARRRAALVDFGVRKVNAAIVVIFGPDGKPIPAGTQIDIGGKEPGLMGYDGEVFLKDLKAQNRININLGAAGKCSATFSYDVNGEAQPRIGPITCS